MADLDKSLQNVSQMRYTIYDDDITVWTSERLVRQQLRAIQDGRNKIPELSNNTDLKISAEKTSVVAIPSAQAGQHLYSDRLSPFYYGGTPLLTVPVTRTLTTLIEESAHYTTWLTGRWETTD